MSENLFSAADPDATVSTARVAFLTVSDYDFFPGTLATVNSILVFHPASRIIVVNNLRNSLSQIQRKLLTSEGVEIIDSSSFERDGRYVGAWELKAYAACDLAPNFDLIIGIDSDCVLCSPLDDVIEQSLQSGHFTGGRDGQGVYYDATYAPYGIETGAFNADYMSTSLYFCPITERNRAALERWADLVNEAVFNGRGAFPGHGDQGVLNAVLFSQPERVPVNLLDNQTWSQHWTYWDSIVTFDDHTFVNHSRDGHRQRSFHCGGAEKFWDKSHSDRVKATNTSQATNYAWWLYLFWFGKCQDRNLDPTFYLPEKNLHLCDDLVNYFAAMRKFDASISLWAPRATGLLIHIVRDVRGCMYFNGSMEDYVEAIRQLPEGSKIVEVGSCEGLSMISLALACLDRDFTFYSVESFAGDLNGSFDGNELPSLQRYLENVKGRFPFLRINSIFERSADASQLFADSTLDGVFIDACHAEEAVQSDIRCWLPKIKPTGVILGDDWSWDSVRNGVGHVFREDQVQVSSSGHVWQVWLDKSD